MNLINKIKSYFTELRNSLYDMDYYNNNRYLNLKDAIVIGTAGKIQRSALNEYTFGFRIFFVSGVYIEVRVDSNQGIEIPPSLLKLRELCIHNMGSSFVTVDNTFKELSIRVVSLNNKFD